jgi:hypothetical protein
VFLIQTSLGAGRVWGGSDEVFLLPGVLQLVNDEHRHSWVGLLSPATDAQVQSQPAFQNDIVKISGRRLCR